MYPLDMSTCLETLYLMRKIFRSLSKLHPNAGARLPSEITLLHPTLLNPTLIYVELQISLAISNNLVDSYLTLKKAC